MNYPTSSPTPSTHNSIHKDLDVVAELERAGEASRRAITEGGPQRSTDQPFLPRYRGSRIANPSPLAFSAIATSLFLMSSISLSSDGLADLGIVPSVGVGYAAIALLVAGIWEFPSGQAWGAALYITLSGFFMSLVLVLSPWTGVASAYQKSASQYESAVGQYFFSFFITMVIFTLAAHRSSGGLIFFMSLLDITLLMFGLMYYYPNNKRLLNATGSFTMITAFVGWYVALASLLTEENSFIVLPVFGDLRRKVRQS